MTDEEIKAVVRKHYKGNKDSLLSNLAFWIAREVSDITEQQTTKHDHDYHREMAFKINNLERELAICKGEDPPPLIAWA